MEEILKIHFDCVLPKNSTRQIGLKELSSIKTKKDLMINYRKVKKICPKGKFTIYIETRCSKCEGKIERKSTLKELSVYLDKKNKSMEDK